MDSALNEPEPEAWTEMTPLLDQAVAELGKTDRDAVVLRFYQHKPLEEVGKALGLNADAAQKRVSRALEKLRKFFVIRGVFLTTTAIAGAISVNAVQAAPAGLAATVSGMATKGAVAVAGAGVGAKILTWLGKLLYMPAALLPVIGSLPSLLVVSLVGRSERRNYRDSQGFRPKLHQSFFRSFIWGFPLFALVFAILNQLVAAAWGHVGLQWFVAGVGLLSTTILARSLAVGSNRYQVSMFAYTLLLTVGVCSLALGWISQATSQLIFWLATLVLLVSLKHRPLRMDYNLFLRASEGMLTVCDEPEISSRTAQVFDRRSLLLFARFLGSRFLVSNFRWEASGLLLCLPPVANRFLRNISGLLLPPSSQGCSTLSLSWKGEVLAHCGKTDASDLAALREREAMDSQTLEHLVATVVRRAWRCHQGGDIAAAEAAVGEVSESDVFVLPPARAKSLRYAQAFLGFLIFIGVGLVGVQRWRPAWLDGFKPVGATEGEVRAFLSALAANSNPGQSRFNSPGAALFSSLVVPSTNLFSQDALRAMREEIVGSQGLDFIRTQSWRAQWVFSTPQARYAFAGGWLTWEDLDLSPDRADFLQISGAEHYSRMDRLLTRREAWSWLRQERYQVLRIDAGGLAQLRLLEHFDGLGASDREGLINQIASAQVLSDRTPGQPPIQNWRAVRGLFFTPCYPALQDTYFSLASLETLVGLGRIDREACVQGILRRHRGGGYFTSPEPGGFNEYHIDGSAKNTIAAFESLRILQALDRVKDLEQWEFRLNVKRPSRQNVQDMTWEKVEAWVCQQRLRQILNDHMKEPEKPFASLLAPQRF